MKKRLKIFFIILLLVLILSFLLSTYLDKKISPIVMEYSVAEAKKIISIIINRSINSDLLENSDIDNLYIINHGERGDILSLNSIVINKLTDIISDACEDNLQLLEEENYDLLKSKFNISKKYFMIPSGIIIGRWLFTNIGLDIPIKLKILGNISSGINTNIQEYGLNNSLVTISINIRVEVMIIIPFDNRIVTFENDVPISIKLIQGSVPEIYGYYK